MSIKNTLIEGVATALQAFVPKAVAESLEGEADKTDSAMGKAVLMLFADYARTEGTKGIDALASSVKKALDSDDPNDILALATKHDALYMSNLVDALQSAEAEEKAKASALVTTLGVVLASVGELLIESAIKSATERL